MNRQTLAACTAAALITSVSASPALAQSYPAPGGIAAEIQRGAQIAAEAVTALSYAFRGTRDSIAMGACRIRAAQHGTATITEAERKSRGRLRVKGTINPVPYAAAGGSYGVSQLRSFSCTVTEDGRITKFKSKRARR